MSDQPKRRGRPFKDAAQRRSTHLKFRTTPQTRQRAEDEAASAGLSLSGYVEAALESHFRASDMRTIVREEVAAALKDERLRKGHQAHAFDGADPGSLPLELRPQWRDYLPS